MQMLSIGGRLTLVKSGLGSMPIFYFFIFKVPLGVLSVIKGATQVGFIAASGRYDNLIGMFGTKRVAAIGVCLGIECVFTIMEQNQKNDKQLLRAGETQVLVSIVGDDLSLAAKLANPASETAHRVQTDFSDGIRRKSSTVTLDESEVGNIATSRTTLFPLRDPKRCDMDEKETRGRRERVHSSTMSYIKFFNYIKKSSISFNVDIKLVFNQQWQLSSGNSFALTVVKCSSSVIIFDWQWEFLRAFYCTNSGVSSSSAYNSSGSTITLFGKSFAINEDTSLSCMNKPPSPSGVTVAYHGDCIAGTSTVMPSTVVAPPAQPKFIDFLGVGDK
nr:histidine--tRNA ligase, cytoplasmic [Tanacetum cinerariifolium]